MKTSQTMDTKLCYKETIPPGHVYSGECCEYFFLRVSSSFRTTEQVTESELKFHTPSKSFFIIQ